MSQATPIVLVVDDDVSVRESLELMISVAGWQPEVFVQAITPQVSMYFSNPFRECSRRP